MQIKALIQKPSYQIFPKLMDTFLLFQKLISELQKKEIPDHIIASINEDIQEINHSPLEGNELRKLIKHKQTKVMHILEKGLKLVVKKHYRNLWMVLGMSAFGLPLGIVFAFSVKNMGLMGIGLPIGMMIGMAVGNHLDKKAAAEGRQIDLEL